MKHAIGFGKQNAIFGLTASGTVHQKLNGTLPTDPVQQVARTVRASREWGGSSNSLHIIYIYILLNIYRYILYICKCI